MRGDTTQYAAAERLRKAFEQEDEANAAELTPGDREQLAQLLDGPVWAGRLTSKSARSKLARLGYVKYSATAVDRTEPTKPGAEMLTVSGERFARYVARHNRGETTPERRPQKLPREMGDSASFNILPHEAPQLIGEQVKLWLEESDGEDATLSVVLLTPEEVDALPEGGIYCYDPSKIDGWGVGS